MGDSEIDKKRHGSGRRHLEPFAARRDGEAGLLYFL